VSIDAGDPRPVEHSNGDAASRRGARIRELFDAATLLPRADRTAYVMNATDQDSIRDEVLEILEFVEATIVEEPTTSGEATEGGVDSLVGSRVGDFELVRLIGTGGTSVVFEARQRRPDRVVAIKVLRSGFAGPRMRRRFEREVEITGKLQHPGIARILASGSVGIGRRESPWLAMEFVPNARSITRYATDEGLDIAARIRLIREVIGAVRYAHGRGVIHRDLKPANILVDGAGSVRVIDFGIARLDESSSSADTLATMPGQVLGTVPFMAPEQIDAGIDGVDVRTDEYSLGVVVYLLLAERMPYELVDCGIVEAARRIRSIEPASLRRYAPKVDRDLDQVVRKMLQKSPDDRYPSIEAVDLELESWSFGRPVLARPITAPARLWRLARRNPLSASLVGTMILVVIATIVILSVMLDRETGLRHLATSAAAEANLASAISAHAAGDIASMEIRLKSIPETERGWVYRWLAADIDPSVMSITGFAGDVIDLDLIDDPSGGVEDWLIVSNYPGLFAIGSESGEEIWFAPWNDPTDGWRHGLIESRDLVAAVDLHGRVKLVRLDTGVGVAMTMLPEPIGEIVSSPSGEELLAVGEMGNLYVLDVPTLELLRQTNTGSRSCRSGVWLSDGRIVVGTREGRVLVFDSDLNPGESVFETESLAIRVDKTDDDRLVAVGFGDGLTVILRSRDWKVEHELVGGKAGIFGLAFDPDGRFVHTVGTDDSIRSFDILTGKQTMMIGSSQGYVWSVAVDGSGDHLWTGGKDGSVRKWRRFGGGLELPQETRPDVAGFEPDGPRFAVVGENGRMYYGDAALGIWDRSRAGERGLEADGRATSICWIEDDALFVGCRSSGLWIVDPVSGESRNVISTGSVAEIVPHPDGGVIVGFSDGRLSHVDRSGTVLKTARLPTPARPHEIPSMRRRMAVSPATRELAIVSTSVHGKTGKVDLDSWELVWSPEKSAVNYDFDIDFSPAGDRLAVVGRERPQNVAVFDFERDDYVGRIAGHLSNATHVEFIESGTRLISAGQDGAVFISRPEDSRPIAKLLQTDQAIRSMCVSKDEESILIVTESGLNIIRAPKVSTDRTEGSAPLSPNAG
jgi:serine/threonine protein kinase/WD40 repeat protein